MIQLTRETLALLVHNLDQNEAELMRWIQDSLFQEEVEPVAAIVAAALQGATPLLIHHDVLQRVLSLSIYGMQVLTHKLAVEGSENRIVPEDETP